MKLSTQIFGVESIDQITEEMLIDYFKEEHEETDLLEFKSFYDKKQGNYKEKESTVLKNICAFLNSSGGIIVWGDP